MEKGNLVKMHYTAIIHDKVIDSSLNWDPVEFKVGEGQILKGLEESVLGLKKGEKKTVMVPPEKAYGQRQENLIGYIPRENFGGSPEQIREGALIQLGSEQGDVQFATVSHVSEHTITLDLNHPLAGQTIKFELEIIDIK